MVNTLFKGKREKRGKEKKKAPSATNHPTTDTTHVPNRKKMPWWFQWHIRREIFLWEMSQVSLEDHEHLSHTDTILHDTIKWLMTSSKCRSVKVINTPVRPRSIHMEVNYTKPQIIKEIELKRTLRCDINACKDYTKIKQLPMLKNPLMVFQISIV